MKRIHFSNHKTAKCGARAAWGQLDTKWSLVTCKRLREKK